MMENLFSEEGLNPGEKGSAAAVPVSGPHIDFERRAVSEGYLLVAGVDEVGRGCLAGPVVAGACILDLSKPLPEGLNDSKKLSEKRRLILEGAILGNAVSHAIGEVDAEEIDRINILQATKKAMKLAIAALDPPPQFLLIDALSLDLPIPQKGIIKGDATSMSIAAASILAKNYRDRLMKELDAVYPEYGFAGHVGYGSKAHFEALRKFGPCPIHRKSFRGVLPEEGLF
jgi:ribonuclease HII